MKRSLTSWSSLDRQTIGVALVVLVLSVGLEWYGRACGFILTSDSIQYLSSAESFHQQGKFLGDDGTYNPYWPPLFPILLSITSKPLVLLGWLNIVCKVVIAGVMLFLAHRFLQSKFYQAAFLIASMLSVHFIMNSVFVWTELLFMALISIHAYFALQPLKSKAIFALILIGFLLCIQRNAGLFWVSGVCLWIFMSDENAVPKKLLTSTFIFVVSTSGLWAWNIYNTYFIPADFIFYDRPFLEGFFSNLIMMAGAFTKMFAPLPGALLHVICVVSGIGLIAFHLKPITKNLFLCIVMVYTLAYTVLGRLDVYEIDRYLSVIVPFVFLAALMAIEKFSEGATKWVRYTIFVLCLFWLSYNLVRTLKNVQMWHERSCLAETSL